MADRGSASAFGIIFSELAADPSDDHKEVATRVWLQRASFDFSDSEMGVDGSLVKLGLASVNEATREVTYR